MICLVLDESRWQIKSHERETDPRDFQNGRTITEVEKPIPKIKMQGKVSSSSRGTFIPLSWPRSEPFPE